MLNSVIDKIHEFNSDSVFYNIVINGDFKDQNTGVICKVVRKGNTLITFMNDCKFEWFNIERILKNTYKLEEVDSKFEG